MAASSNKGLIWFLVIVAIAGIATTTSLLVWPHIGGASADVKTTAVAATGPLGISCIGRVESENGPIVMGARSLSGQPSLVGELLVHEGDYVKAGQVVAILNSHDQLEAAARQAEARIKLAAVRRDQVMAGAKSADIAAQNVEIARLELEQQAAQIDFNRTENLFKQGIAAQAVLDQSRLVLDTKPKLISAAKERLRSLTEVRQIDIDVANAELQSAMADAELARAEAEAATVHSSYSGRVQKINAWKGEEVGPNGILELAMVEHMYVVAEVAESDLPRVKPGQSASITGDSIPGKLQGKVTQIGTRVSKNSMVLRDPVNLTDARIVEVRILLDDPAAVKNLIDAQVDVHIVP